MSEFPSPYDTWSTLLHDLNSSLAGHGAVLIPDEDAFDRAFVKLCPEVEEPDPQRLLGRFMRQHGNIIAYVGELDKAHGFSHLPCLNSVFWSVAFATVKAALERKKKSIIFADHLPKLNKAVPAFGADVALFPHVPQVQKPLQNVFDEYMACYSTMLGQFASHPTSLSMQPFDDRVGFARNVFEKSKQEWEDIVTRAQEEEKNRLVASMPSFPQGTLGPVHPYAPRGVSFEWVRKLGTGAFGHVSEVRQLGTGRIFAQKVIRVTDPQLRPQIKKQVENEVSIMEKLRHHHIASVHFYSHEEDTFSIIMLPVADCDLLQFLRRRSSDPSLPRAELADLTSWFGCLISALAFAHDQNIKHEDIKPQNILIKKHRPYLSDFGSAKDFSELDRSTSTDILKFGTPIYWPPENPPHGRGADIFALGCVFSEMMTVRQGRTLDDYQIFRHRENSNWGYAFNTNLPKVYTWLEKMKQPHDLVGDLLLEQTSYMLADDKSTRPKARDIKRGLRLEGDSVFCSVCS